MSYRYEAAPSHQASPCGRPAPQIASLTGSHYRPAYSASDHSVASCVKGGSTRSVRFAPSTLERWHAVQAPTTHTTIDKRAKRVHFAPAGESPLPAYLNLDTPIYSPPPASVKMYSPRVPSLSHSAYGAYDDDLECPHTYEHESIPLPPVNAKATKSWGSTLIPSKHQDSYTAINEIIHEMNSLLFSFQCPTDLEFEPMSRDQPVLKLTRTSKNRPLLELNQRLKNLQSKLHAVESHGDADVRKARKVAVRQVERALEDIKRVQAIVWNKRVCEQRKKRHT